MPLLPSSKLAAKWNGSSTTHAGGSSAHTVCAGPAPGPAPPHRPPAPLPTLQQPPILDVAPPHKPTCAPPPWSKGNPSASPASPSGPHARQQPTSNGNGSIRPPPAPSEGQLPAGVDVQPHGASGSQPQHVDHSHTQPAQRHTASTGSTDAARILTTRIQRCSSWQQLRALLAVHEGSSNSGAEAWAGMGRANAVHAVAALTTVARAIGGSSSSSNGRKQGVLLSQSQRQEALHFVNATLLPLAARALSPLPNSCSPPLKPPDSSNPGSSSTESSSSGSSSRSGAQSNAAGGLRAREASSMLHALATARHAPPLNWLALYLGHVRHLLPSYSPRDAATTVWALAQVAEAALAQEQHVQQSGSSSSSSGGDSARIGSSMGAQRGVSSRGTFSNTSSPPSSHPGLPPPLSRSPSPSPHSSPTLSSSPTPLPASDPVRGPLRRPPLPPSALTHQQSTPRPPPSPTQTLPGRDHHHFPPHAPSMPQQQAPLQQQQQQQQQPMHNALWQQQQQRQAVAALLRPFVVELLAHIAGLPQQQQQQQQPSNSPVPLLFACNPHDMANITMGSLKLATLLLDDTTCPASAANPSSALATTPEDSTPSSVSNSNTHVGSSSSSSSSSSSTKSTSIGTSGDDASWQQLATLLPHWRMRLLSASLPLMQAYCHSSCSPQALANIAHGLTRMPQPSTTTPPAADLPPHLTPTPASSSPAYPPTSSNGIPSSSSSSRSSSAPATSSTPMGPHNQGGSDVQQVPNANTAEASTQLAPHAPLERAWAHAFIQACLSCLGSSDHSSSSSSVSNSSFGPGCTPHSLCMIAGAGVDLLGLPPPPSVTAAPCAPQAFARHKLASPLHHQQQLQGPQQQHEVSKSSSSEEEESRDFKHACVRWSRAVLAALHAQLERLGPEDATSVSLVLPRLLHAAASQQDPFSVARGSPVEMRQQQPHLRQQQLQQDAWSQPDVEAFLGDVQASITQRLHKFEPRQLSLILVSLARLSSSTLPDTSPPIPNDSNPKATPTHSSSRSTINHSTALTSDTGSDADSSIRTGPNPAAGVSAADDPGRGVTASLYGAASSTRMLSMPSRDFLRCWCAAALAKVPSFSSVDATQALWALATLRVSPPPGLPALLLQATRPQLPTTPPSTLALLLWSLSALRYRPPWQWQLDFFQATLSPLPLSQHSAAPPRASPVPPAAAFMPSQLLPFSSTPSAPPFPPSSPPSPAASPPPPLNPAAPSVTLPAPSSLPSSPAASPPPAAYAAPSPPSAPSPSAHNRVLYSSDTPSGPGLQTRMAVLLHAGAGPRSQQSLPSLLHDLALLAGALARLQLRPLPAWSTALLDTLEHAFGVLHSPALPSRPSPPVAPSQPASILDTATISAASAPTGTPPASLPLQPLDDLQQPPSSFTPSQPSTPPSPSSSQSWVPTATERSIPGSSWAASPGREVPIAAPLPNQQAPIIFTSPAEHEALVTLCWALLRLRIQPRPPLLAAMLRSAARAAPALPAPRATLLVWSLLRLARNVEGRPGPPQNSTLVLQGKRSRVPGRRSSSVGERKEEQAAPPVQASGAAAAAVGGAAVLEQPGVVLSQAGPPNAGAPHAAPPHAGVPHAGAPLAAPPHTVPSAPGRDILPPQAAALQPSLPTATPSPTPAAPLTPAWAPSSNGAPFDQQQAQQRQQQQAQQQCQLQQQLQQQQQQQQQRSMRRRKLMQGSVATRSRSPSSPPPPTDPTTSAPLAPDSSADTSSRSSSSSSEGMLGGNGTPSKAALGDLSGTSVGRCVSQMLTAYMSAATTNTNPSATTAELTGTATHHSLTPQEIPLGSTTTATSNSNSSKPHPTAPPPSLLQTPSPLRSPAHPAALGCAPRPLAMAVSAVAMGYRWLHASEPTYIASPPPPPHLDQSPRGSTKTTTSTNSGSGSRSTPSSSSSSSGGSPSTSSSSSGAASGAADSSSSRSAGCHEPGHTHTQGSSSLSPRRDLLTASSAGVQGDGQAVDGNGQAVGSENGWGGGWGSQGLLVAWLAAWLPTHTTCLSRQAAQLSAALPSPPPLTPTPQGQPGPSTAPPLPPSSQAPPPPPLPADSVLSLLLSAATSLASLLPHAFPHAPARHASLSSQHTPSPLPQAGPPSDESPPTIPQMPIPGAAAAAPQPPLQRSLPRSRSRGHPALSKTLLHLRTAQPDALRQRERAQLLEVQMQQLGQPQTAQPPPLPMQQQLHDQGMPLVQQQQLHEQGMPHVQQQGGSILRGWLAHACVVAVAAAEVVEAQHLQEQAQEQAQERQGAQEKQVLTRQQRQHAAEAARLRDTHLTEQARLQEHQHQQQHQQRQFSRQQLQQQRRQMLLEHGRQAAALEQAQQQELQAAMQALRRKQRQQWQQVQQRLRLWLSLRHEKLAAALSCAQGVQQQQQQQYQKVVPSGGSSSSSSSSSTGKGHFPLMPVHGAGALLPAPLLQQLLSLLCALVRFGVSIGEARIVHPLSALVLSHWVARHTFARRQQRQRLRLQLQQRRFMQQRAAQQRRRLQQLQQQGLPVSPQPVPLHQYHHHQHHLEPQSLPVHAPLASPSASSHPPRPPRLKLRGRAGRAAARMRKVPSCKPVDTLRLGHALLSLSHACSTDRDVDGSPDRDLDSRVKAGAGTGVGHRKASVGKGKRATEKEEAQGGVERGAEGDAAGGSAEGRLRLWPEREVALLCRELRGIAVARRVLPKQQLEAAALAKLLLRRAS